MPEPQNESTRPASPDTAAHVADAHRLLQTLRTRIGEHPELGEAITKLEMALNTLAVKTGGML